MTPIERLMAATEGTTWKSGCSVSAWLDSSFGMAAIEIRVHGKALRLGIEEAKSLAEWILSLTREE